MRTLPPSWAYCSSTVTRWPRSAATRAASSPAGPPPTTTTRRGAATGSRSPRPGPPQQGHSVPARGAHAGRLEPARPAAHHHDPPRGGDGLEIAELVLPAAGAVD